MTSVSCGNHYNVQKVLCDSNLPYVYFSLTPGDGACWFNAIVEIFQLVKFKNFLSNDVQRAVTNPLILRHRIIDFIAHFDNNNPDFVNLKNAQISTLLLNSHGEQNPNVLWFNFLNNMREPFEWACDIILQMTAWYLQVNIKMISLDVSRRYEYSLPSLNPTEKEICIGYSNNHFQSLIPIDYLAVEKICLGCKKSFKNIVLHLNKAELCKNIFCYSNFISKFSGRDSNRRKKEDQQRYENEKSIRKEQAKVYYYKNRDSISQKRKDHNVPRQRCKVLKTKHVSDPIFKSFLIDVKGHMPSVKLLHCKRQNLTPLQAIMAFRLENLYGAKFVCIVCHKIKFANGVKVLTPSKFPTQFVEKFMLVKYFDDPFFQVNGSLWICHTCEEYIKNFKMPPMSAANFLDSVSPPVDLQLSEIENALLAPVF